MISLDGDSADRDTVDDWLFVTNAENDGDGEGEPNDGLAVAVSDGVTETEPVNDAVTRPDKEGDSVLGDGVAVNVNVDERVRTGDRVLVSGEVRLADSCSDIDSEEVWESLVECVTEASADAVRDNLTEGVRVAAVSLPYRVGVGWRVTVSEELGDGVGGGVTVFDRVADTCEDNESDDETVSDRVRDAFCDRDSVRSEEGLSEQPKPCRHVRVGVDATERDTVVAIDCETVLIDDNDDEGDNRTDAVCVIR